MLLLLLLAIAAGVTGCAVYNSMSKQLPDPDLRNARGRDQSSIIMDRNGKALVRLFAEQNRVDVKLSKMPAHLRQAIIATEDKRFYEHQGVDPLGLARAVWVDVLSGRKAQGGSTITQQYVKQAFVTSEKTLKRKVQEAILAQKVEQKYSKDEILELYLNTIYFGHGAYGVEAASRAYFGRGVAKLSIAQSAMLAGIVKAPSHYSPYLQPDQAVRRRNTVLTLMRDQNYITSAEYDKAVASPLKVVGLKPPSAQAPYFVEWVKANLLKKYGEKALYRGGLRVKTTLDPAVQHAAERAITRVLNQKGDPAAAIVAMNPKTGEVVAMVGGQNFKKQQFNVATQGLRQPGSAFKPFVLATALGEGVSPEKAFLCGARSFSLGSQTWRVSGTSGGAKATMRLRQATEKSVNSVFAQLILDVGPEDVVKTAEKLGIHEDITPVPAIALGGLKDGVSPLEMATAYSTLAAGGMRPTPFGIDKVQQRNGKVLDDPEPQLKAAIDPAVAYLTTDILTGVIKRGTGTAADIGRPAAGKTGTTQEYRDAWFVGYTPDLVCAVWVGYPESQREMKSVHGREVTGGSFPAQIWADFMREALADTPPTKFPKPTGLTRVKLCAETGALATEFCPQTITATVIAKFKPDSCQKHKTALQVDVPNVVGMTKIDALAAIEKVHLVAKVIEKEISGVEIGAVASQSPGAKQKVKSGSTVTIVVSKGAGANATPVPAFDPPKQAKAGQAVSLDGSGSTDDGSIAKYFWEFGDNQTATGKSVSHVWAAPGTYEITLWVTDNRGKQASLTKSVLIK